MSYQGEKKYRIFGVSLVLFIMFLLFIAIKPKPGLNDVLANQSNTDSIQIIDLKNHLALTFIDSSQKAPVFEQLRKAVKINPARINIGNWLHSLRFFNSKTTREVVLVSSPFDGLMIRGDQAFFRNDSLWTFVQNKFKRQ